MKAPINSIKHLVQHTEFTVSSATVTTQTDVKGRQFESSVNSADDVVQGSVIKAIFIELWLVTASAATGSFVVMFEKAPAGATSPTFTNMTTLDAYPNKKNVLYITQGLLGDSTSNPTPVYRDWLKIPKGKQRFGLNDDFKINIAALGAADIKGCGITIYKVYN